MKKLLAVLTVLTVLAALPAAAFETRYASGVFGGGAGDMDAIDGSVLSDGDHCEVVDPVTRLKSIYVLDADSGLAHNPPGVVTPISNAGLKRWILSSVKVQELQAEEITAGSVPQYREAFIPASSFTPWGTNGAAAGSYETVINGVTYDYFDFDPTTEEAIQANINLIGYRSGGNIKAKVYWAPAGSGATLAETCEWEITMRGITGGYLFDGGTVGAVISDAVNNDTYQRMHISDPTPTITPAGLVDNEVYMVVVVSRNVAGADDMPIDARLYGVKIQYAFDGAASVSPW